MEGRLKLAKTRRKRAAVVLCAMNDLPLKANGYKSHLVVLKYQIIPIA
jgi:hypothetical protein